MTKKLYYEDPYIQTFSAKITKQEENYVVLSETAFYPTGGGQPHDGGTINRIDVTNVEIIDGEIRHFLEENLPSNIEFVECSIIWKRRFDHMQQHTGQHILSAAFDNLFSMKTVSFHLGKDSSTIDIDISEISDHQLKEVEALSNQIILQNNPIETKWVTEEELALYKLRKPTAVKEDIRLVIIPNFDYNACGGTHPKRTGEVGLIKILQIEKQKRLIRVEFICGERVLTHLDRKQKILVNLKNSLSAPEEKLGDAVKALLDNGKTLEKEVSNLKDLLLQYEAKDLISSTKETIITSIFQNRSIQELQKLAKFITVESTGTICILISENEDRSQIVAAKGEAVKQSMKELIVKVLPLINGKGGGNDIIAQGGGENMISSKKLLEKSVAYVTS
ncbi:alanyl-tRNA editing protein [Psychrobacillus vulpis]|uniref:Alanyl-tRNA editing protein n=1 Tax=Psychrobacillus vulpis TaxID=2325572 RepID=A0A544TRP6_9BACI|nr:DHHA1 domain-containing protein [Psychrobacillus vulpis]TQR20126.1 alanyl-tRNA editing protein [Psychrobacillus vulpis]